MPWHWRRILQAALVTRNLHLTGLGHGSLSRIHSEYKTVFGVSAAASPPALSPHIARAKARLAGLVGPVSAVLSFRDVAGVMVMSKTVTNLVVEAGPLDWATLPLLARVTFDYGSEPLEEVIPVEDLGVDAAAVVVPLPPPPDARPPLERPAACAFWR